MKPVLLILLIGLAAARADNIDCDFRDSKSQTYTCIVTSEVINKDDNITIGGDHGEEKDDTDVISVAFFDSTVETVPRQYIKKFPFVEYLRMESSGLKEIEQNSFNDATNLKEFYGTSNIIQRLDSEVFLGAKRLKLINLQDNEIDFIDENAFKKLSKLELLQLSRNYISVLHRNIFVNLVHLKYVYLFSNQIEDLPKGLFRKNIRIKSIELGNNKIKTIHPDVFKKLSKLEDVNLVWNICISQTFEKGFSDLSSLHEEIETCNEANTIEARIEDCNKKLKNKNVI